VASQSTTAHAATLPDNYQGTWYGYQGPTWHHGVKYYYVNQMKLTQSGENDMMSVTKNADLSGLTVQTSGSIKATYTLKNDRHKQAFYQMKLAIDGASNGRYQLTTVKVKGKKTPTLAWTIDGNTYYAFKKVTKAHSWDAVDD